MSDPRLRRSIARRAAQLMYLREESEYFTAKRKAAREFGVDYRFRPKDLPSNREIRDDIQIYADLIEGETRREHLNDMRIDALRMMRLLRPFHPHLIGSVLTGHVRTGSDIDLHIFSDSISAVTCVLDDEGLHYHVEHKRIVKHNQARLFTHVHVPDRFEFELTLYPADKLNYHFRSSITGKAIERASISELENLLRHDNPGTDLDTLIDRLDDHINVYELFRMLLLPLENVKQNPKHHPEGDALYHSLQVFQLALDARPWDEEFLLAALLHDVGKAIDPADHVAAALISLEGTITPRTAFLIEHHMQAHAARDGTLGARAKRRLVASEDYDDLLLLSEFDKAGRKRGMLVPTIDQALEIIHQLAAQT